MTRSRLPSSSPDRYITGRCLPDKAIDVIDEAGARVRLKAMTRPPDLKEIDEQVEELNRAKEDAVANQDFERAAQLRDQADKLRAKKQAITQQWRDKANEKNAVVDEEVIAEVVSKMTGIPLTRLSTEDTMRLMEMEKGLHGRVISPGGSDQGDLQGRSSQSQRFEGSQATGGMLHLCRPDGRR